MSLRSATLTSLAMLGFALATTALATEIEFTRHLESIDANARSSSTFTATPGVGQLSISSQASETPLEITLNDERLGLAPAIQLGNNAITVTLLEQNSITVQSSTERSLTIRITQQADVVTHVESRVHFNTNVSNFEQAREFYGALGFKTLTGFPDTNTLAMAHAIGVTTPTEYDGSKGDHAGGYLLHGELIGVGGYKGGLIDLIEFTIPRNDEPPYAKTNHLGMASAVLYSSNIDADYANVRKLGATTLSAPVTRADGIRFFVFTDPDGTFYEVQQSGEVDSSEQSSHLIGLGPVYFNVSDFERSRAWYQMLGFVETAAIPPEQQRRHHGDKTDGTEHPLPGQQHQHHGGKHQDPDQLIGHQSLAPMS